MNPYTRPSSGYLPLILQGFENLGLTNEYTAFKESRIKLGIVSSFMGDVISYPSIVPVLIGALETLEPTEGSKYYIYGLKTGIFLPVSTSNAVAFSSVEEQQIALAKHDKVYKSGELYFTT